MNIKILLFGVTRDMIGESTLDIQVSEGQNVGEMLEDLKTRFPELSKLRSLLVAVNDEYAEEGKVLNQSDEIALIPPVSGG
ncbi:MAG: molybdopterin converting factor subunit 1 [Saprospiraceae bacterium]|nr:molybdopterin converting factor subunit 1 [Saprospiraceae bacterium]